MTTTTVTTINIQPMPAGLGLFRTSDIAVLPRTISDLNPDQPQPM